MNLFDKYYYGDEESRYTGTVNILGKKKMDEIVASEVHVKGMLKSGIIRCNGLYVDGNVESDVIETGRIDARGRISSESITGKRMEIMGMVSSEIIRCNEIRVKGRIKSENIYSQELYVMGEISSEYVKGKSIEINGKGKVEKIEAENTKIERERYLFRKMDRLEIETLISESVEIEDCIVNRLECNNGKIGRGTLIRHLKAKGEIIIKDDARILERE
ncbi:MAG: hypothetical protein ACPLVI_04520 [Thermoplasmata archaeon]